MKPGSRRGGTLTYTWGRRGPQPTLKPAGQRQGYKVFGLIASCTGRFVYPGQAGGLNCAAYRAFLKRVPERTTQHLRRIQEGAKSHTSAETKACFAQQTARLEVFPLPCEAPDSTPLAKRWKTVTQAGTPRHACPTVEALTDKVTPALRKFAHTPAAILPLGSRPTDLVKAAYGRRVRHSSS